MPNLESVEVKENIQGDALRESLMEIDAFYAVINKNMQLKHGINAEENVKKQTADSVAIKIPSHPYDADIDANIKQARENFNPFWFIDMLKNYGPWDYKRKDKDYEDFGNFNYGAVASAFGFMDKWVLQAAGLYQITSNKGTPVPFKEGFFEKVANFGVAFLGPPYGDHQEDQEMIKLGMRYCKEIYMKKYHGSSTAKEDILQAMEQATKSSFPMATYITKSLQQLLN